MSDVMNNVDVVSVVATSGIKAKVTVKFSDDTSKTLNISEGDQIKNLTYLTEGVEKTINGEVKVINYTASPVKPLNNCIHSTKSEFSKKVTLINMMVDCSTEFNSDLRIVPFSCIKDFDTDDAGEMIVTEVEMNNGIVTFSSTTTPAVVLWNNEPIIPVQEDPNVDVYAIQPTTMHKVNVMIVLDADNRVKTLVKGIAPTICDDDSINSNVFNSFNYVTTLYNQYTDVESVTVDDTSYYATIATGLGATSTITINGQEFGADENVPFPVGNNSYVNKPVFTVVDGVLSVGALALINLATENYDISIKVNGYDIQFTVDAENAKLPEVVEPETPNTGDDETTSDEPTTEEPTENNTGEVITEEVTPTEPSESVDETVIE